MEVRNIDLDLHMHSKASDGTDNPAEILLRARKAGLSWFSLTDHDTYEGCEEIAEQIPADSSPRFVYGVEFSCKDQKGKYHILGYDFDPDSSAMREIVKKAHENRIEKVNGRMVFLKDRFGFSFSEEDLEELMRNPNPGKPHIGNLMVKYGYAKTKDQAIRDYVNQYHSKKKLYVEPEEAIRAILAGGGIPILAHPVFGDGGQNLNREELMERVCRLCAAGLAGLECYYNRYTSGQQEMLLSLAEKKDLYASAGSDYHGANKKVRFGDIGPGFTELHPCLERLLKEFEERRRFR